MKEGSNKGEFLIAPITMQASTTVTRPQAHPFCCFQTHTYNHMRCTTAYTVIIFFKWRHTEIDQWTCTLKSQRQSKVTFVRQFSFAMWRGYILCESRGSSWLDSIALRSYYSEVSRDMAIYSVEDVVMYICIIVRICVTTNCARDAWTRPASLNYQGSVSCEYNLHLIKHACKW